jgi:hypothetical protein
VICQKVAIMKSGHLWAVGYENMERAEQVRAAVGADGRVTLDGEPYVTPVNLSGHTFASFLAGLALGAPPVTGAAAGALGGTVLKTNVDLERARLIQSTLAKPAADG